MLYWYEQISAAFFVINGAAGSADHGLLVVCGGDGTLHCVINALGEKLPSIPLGLIPLGTGNDFARSIGVPPDLVKALQMLEIGTARKLGTALLCQIVPRCIAGTGCPSRSD